jgi:uncharacterized protein (TIGR02246 family)
MEEEVASIRKTIDSYVAAFNRGDANAVAEHWTEAAVFITPAGEKLEGRQAIHESFASYLEENKGASIEIDATSIRIEGANLAVEEGIARVSSPDGLETATNYVAKYTKQDGAWKLTSVQEHEPPPSHYEQLKELDWLVGEWVNQDEAANVELVCQWTKNMNFLTRSFAVSVEDRIDMEGTQVIGWDPAEEVIRSWLFDSDGGFGVAAWKQDGDSWTIQSVQVLADGRKASSVYLLTRIDDDTFSWGSRSREVDGEILPNINPITVVRKRPSN